MVLKNVFIAIVCVVFLAWSGTAGADEYRPNQLLNLDLSKAVFSPIRLGPPAAFAPVPVEAEADSEGSVAQGRVSHLVRSQIRPVHDKSYAVAHSRLARRHSDPLDAQAFDARIQIWPCRSGGICNWKR